MVRVKRRHVSLPTAFGVAQNNGFGNNIHPLTPARWALPLIFSEKEFFFLLFVVRRRLVPNLPDHLQITFDGGKASISQRGNLFVGVATKLE